MMVIRGSEAPRFELPGLEFTGLAAPSRGSAELCAWRLTVAPGTAADAPHTLDHDEVFLVARGAVRLAPGGDVVAAGDAAVVPAGEPIQLSNAGDGPAVVYVTIRAGFQAKMADGTSIGTPPWALIVPGMTAGAAGVPGGGGVLGPEGRLLRMVVVAFILAASGVTGIAP